MKRAALIGGGGTGIGRAVARRLATDGVSVVVTGRRPDVLRAAAAEIDGDLGTAPPLQWAAGDLTVAADVDAVVRAAHGQVGDIDILVLNAGGPPPGTILTVEEPAWHDALDLLLVGPLRLARALMPTMAERGFGRVVLVTSAIVRQPVPDLALSVVLRSAATSMAKLLSLEYATSGVTVNCVAPGPTATLRRTEILESRAVHEGLAMDVIESRDAAAVPAGRAGRPDEIADAIAFLASDAASYINGSVLTVDGGLTGLVW